jgi:hypothetical protein
MDGEQGATTMLWHDTTTGVVNDEIGPGLEVTAALEKHIMGAADIPVGLLEEASPRTTVPLHGLVLTMVDGR